MSYPVPSIFSAAFELRAIALSKVAKSLPHYAAIPVPIVRHLVDQHLLLETLKRTNFRGKVELVDLQDDHSEYTQEEEPATIVYGDYSFAMAPAYKAFEGYLHFIAEVFEFPVEKYQKRIGYLYDWDADQKHTEFVLAALESKLGTDKEGLDRWRELSMVLRTYRHNPAHYTGDKVDTYEQAENCVKTILNTINQMTKYLIGKGILLEESDDIDAICRVT